MKKRTMIIGSALTLALCALGQAAHARSINGNAGRQSGGKNRSFPPR